MPYQSNLWRTLITLVLISLSTSSFSAPGWALASQLKQIEEPAENNAGVKPVLGSSSRNDTSPALREVKPVEARTGITREIPYRSLPKASGKETKSEYGQPAVVQNQLVQPNMPGLIANFEGMNNVNGALPPDTQGDIGVDPDTDTKYYMQWVNLSFQIWDVTNPTVPISLYGPAGGNTLFSGFGGPCETTNDGDPIVLFDHLANRWLASQFALPNYPAGPFYECIAISKSADPTGAWHRYEFLISNTKMDDYPKFGVWLDGYYMSINQFHPNWAGAGAVAFEREAMLTGAPADMVYFDVGAVNLNYGGMLPSDLDGTPPPDGTPNFFVEWDDSSWLGDPEDTLRIWEFHVDWANPTNSTFGINASYAPNYLIPTSDVNPTITGIQQPDGAPQLDPIADRLMYRLQYRNFGNHQALVSNHTVDASGNDRAGIHWFELRDSGAGWELYQDGVYALGSENRWMGSAALDASGDIALGYSISSTSVYPSIRYTGRLVSDPLNTLPQGEVEMIAGSGVQTYPVARWGDYSMMGVDPVDQCTFWYTQEYYATTSQAGWQTRIGSFKYPSCTQGARGSLEGTITDESIGEPLEGVIVSLGGGLTGYSDEDGFYRISNIPVGLYDVTASMFGYVSKTLYGAEVLADEVTHQNFSLSPIEMVTVEGAVMDGSGHPGMPLYARLDISGYPFSPIFTDPATGHYSLELPEGVLFTFNVSAVSIGYQAESRDIIPQAGGSIEDFILTADEALCSAPGYRFPGYRETFDSGALPIGWTAVDNTGGGGWAFDDPGGRGNLTGGSGLFAIVDSDYYGLLEKQDAELISPVFDFSTFSSVSLEFDTDFNSFSGEVSDVDVSNDGGTSWINVWRKSGADYRGPAHEVVNITALAAGQPDVVARFHYYNARWEYWWQVDNAFIGAQCEPIPGGMLVGNVYDLNTGEAVNGAMVTSDGAAESATTGATPDDPNLDDGFFTLFTSLSGKQSFTASMSGGYGAVSEAAMVMKDGAVFQEFNLLAGMLGAAPDSISVTLDKDQTAEKTLTLGNSGSLAANFEIFEVNTAPVSYAPTGPFADISRHVTNKHRHDLDASFVIGYSPPAANPLEAGEVINAWGADPLHPWGIGFNTNVGDLWVGDLVAAGGDNLNHQYLPDGTGTGNTIDTSAWVREFAADMTYNPFTGMLWQVNVGDDNCIYEMDSLRMTTTGNQICPSFPTSERGLAYDPISDTYYSGSWNDWVIYHFASDGTILDSVDTRLNISGLAFNPSTNHLFVMTNSSEGMDVYVLDAANDYVVVGGFQVDGLGSYEQVSLEIDCQGHLWAVNWVTQEVFEIDSGENGVCAWEGIPWLSETPVSATVPAGGEERVTLIFDATGLAPGTYEAHLRINEDTPYDSIVVPLTLTVVGDKLDVFYMPLIEKEPNQ